MSKCDCGAAPFGRHTPDCTEVDLRRRKRIDCAKCELDDQAQADGEWFRDRDWCASCEVDYRGAARRLA